jgi:hypothetical protein
MDYMNYAAAAHQPQLSWPEAFLGVGIVFCVCAMMVFLGWFTTRK